MSTKSKSVTTLKPFKPMLMDGAVYLKGVAKKLFPDWNQ